MNVVLERDRIAPRPSADGTERFGQLQQARPAEGAVAGNVRVRFFQYVQADRTDERRRHGLFIDVDVAGLIHD